MSSLTIMLARHAEKPGGAFPGEGLTYEGKPDEKSLVVRGWQRAGAWAALFSQGEARGDYPPPNVIYAAKPKPVSEDASFSHRPWETAVPVAKRLHLDPNYELWRHAGSRSGQGGRQADRRRAGILGAQSDCRGDHPSLLEEAGSARNSDKMGRRSVRCRASLRSSLSGRAGRFANSRLVFLTVTLICRSRSASSDPGSPW